MLLPISIINNQTNFIYHTKIQKLFISQDSKKAYALNTIPSIHFKSILRTHVLSDINLVSLDTRFLTINSVL